MSKRRIAAVAGIVILVLITCFIISRKSEGKKQVSYISDTECKVKLEDIKNHFRKIEFNEKNTRELFSEKVINKYTIKFLKSLQVKFRDMDYESHLNAIRDYLFSRIPHDDAEQLFAIYLKYVKYEKEMAAKMQSWGMPRSPEHMLEMLSKIQKAQVDLFGEEAAGVLFGAELKAREYPIRRKIIINDIELYGAEKEEKLKKLNQDMWGDESESAGYHRSEYDRYRDKLSIYSKDLTELTEMERKEKIKSYREEFFNPKAVRKMEQVDEYIVKEEQYEKNYRTEEQRILSDLDLDEDKKKLAIEKLQVKHFGKDGAERWRRREILRKAL